MLADLVTGPERVWSLERERFPGGIYASRVTLLVRRGVILNLYVPPPEPPNPSDLESLRWQCERWVCDGWDWKLARQGARSYRADQVRRLIGHHFNEMLYGQPAEILAMLPPEDRPVPP